MGNGLTSLVVANQLNKSYGHSVIVYECANQIGGLMVYGVTYMKNKLDVIQRHVDLMVEEGVNFFMNANVGVGSLFSMEKIHTQNSVLLLACAVAKRRCTFYI